MIEKQSSPTMVGPDEGATVAGLTMVHKVGAGLLEGGLQVMEGLIAPQRITMLQWSPQGVERHCVSRIWRVSMSQLFLPRSANVLRELFHDTG